MIFVAYAFLVVTVIAYIRGTIHHVPGRLEIAARVLGAVVGVGFFFVALLLLGNAPPALGAGVLLLLAIGAAVYVWGLLHWRTPDGFVLRRIGWFAIVAALAFPSTLTLLMPIACALVLTVDPMPRSRTAFGRFSPSSRR